MQKIRKMLGQFVEWLITYDHEITIKLDVGAKFPFHKYDGDAGSDLTVSVRTAIPARTCVNVPSGVYIESKSKIWIEIKARSSTMRVRGLEVVDAVIDHEYRGELFAAVYNPKNTTQFVEAGDRIAQIVPHRLIPLFFKEGILNASARGTDGFGSTGGISRT